MKKSYERRDLFFIFSRIRGGEGKRTMVGTMEGKVLTAGESGDPSRQSESNQELLTLLRSSPFSSTSNRNRRRWFNVPPPSRRRKQGRPLARSNFLKASFFFEPSSPGTRFF